MRKIFCDHCKAEINCRNAGFNATNGEAARGELKASKYASGRNLNIRIAPDAGMSNEFDFCKHCILDAIEKLDDRIHVAPSIPVPETKGVS